MACPSWSSRLHHPNTLSTAFLERFLASACYSQFSSPFLLRFRATLLRLPSSSSSPLPKIPRTSHLSFRNFFVSSDASRASMTRPPPVRGAYDFFFLGGAGGGLNLSPLFCQLNSYVDLESPKDFVDNLIIVPANSPLLLIRSTRIIFSTALSRSF